MVDFMFKELSELMQAVKAADAKLTPEERNRNDAEDGLDELASLMSLLKETEEHFNMLFDNPLLSKDKDAINTLGRLWLNIGSFVTTDVHIIERTLSQYIDDEEEDIYG